MLSIKVADAIFDDCCALPNIINSMLDGLRASRHPRGYPLVVRIHLIISMKQNAGWLLYQ